MTTKLARVLLLVLVLALLAVAAGCGGDDDDEGDDAAAVTQTSGDGSDDDAMEDDDGEDASGLASDECEELAELSTKMGEAFSGTGGSDDIQEQAEFFEDFADETPEEIREDFQVIAEAYTKLADALEDADLQAGEQPDPEAIQKLQEATQSLDQERLNEASANIQKWSEENC